MASKFHNPVAVAAMLRSGAGKHRETRQEVPCCWCGEDTGGPTYCSADCEIESVADMLDVVRNHEDCD